MKRTILLLLPLAAVFALAAAPRAKGPATPPLWQLYETSLTQSFFARETPPQGPAPSTMHRTRVEMDPRAAPSRHQGP